MVVAGATALPDDAEISGPAWIGREVEIGPRVRLTGPIVLGDGASIGAGAQLRETIVLPGTEIAPCAILIGAIAGHTGIVESLRTRRSQAGAPRRLGVLRRARRADAGSGARHARLVAAELVALAAQLLALGLGQHADEQRRPARCPSRATARRP